MAIQRKITANISAPQAFRVNGPFKMYSSGSFGSGTVTLERRNFDGAFIAVAGGSYTAVFAEEVSAADNDVFRLSMAGSTNPTVVIEIPGVRNEA